MSLSKKEKRRMEIEAEETKKAGLEPEGKVQKQSVQDGVSKSSESLEENEKKAERSVEVVEIPKEGVVCG